MAPIKPLAPLSAPPVTPGHKPAPAGKEPEVAFRPGPDAPRKTALAQGAKPDIAPAPTPQSSTIAKPLTLQALSAYAGIVIGTQDAGHDGPAVAQADNGGPTPSRAGDAPPPPPGTILDLKV